MAVARRFVRVLFEYKTEGHNVLTLCEVRPVDYIPNDPILEQQNFVAIHVELTDDQTDPVALAKELYEKRHPNRPQFLE